MESTSPIPNAPEQRLLAVIVFTDVVGFTSRMQTDEPTTLTLLDRDFTTMRKLGERLAGTVIKTTGDGLLLYFTSAVRAMAWAIRAQRHFAELAKTEAPDQILRHRVGIHLGDVYLRADDVMGDGVNIAARLLAEAPPGGICISQTVYEVVKNKLKLHVIRLEPRKLKNLKEPIQMYHVLLEAPQRITPAPFRRRDGPAATPAVPRARSASRIQKLAAAGLLLAGLGLVATLIAQAYFEHENELARSEATHRALGAALRAGRAGAAGAGTAVKPAVANDPVEEFDFAKMIVEGPTGGAGTATNDEGIRQKASEVMQPLFAWMKTGLPRYNRDRPLNVRLLRDGSIQDQTVYTGSDHQLNLKQGGATVTRRDWTEFKLGDQAAVIVSALLDSPEPPPRAVIHGAEAFAYFHRLPEMAKALLRARSPAGHTSP